MSYKGLSSVRAAKMTTNAFAYTSGEIKWSKSETKKKERKRERNEQIESLSRAQGC